MKEIERERNIGLECRERERERDSCQILLGLEIGLECNKLG